MKTAIVIVAVLSIPVLAFSATIYVPGDYSTIQGAIDAAVNGDTIIVRPGTYVENIDFLGKAITLTSELGASVTTIDGNQAGSVVACQSGEGPDSVLDDFTITNGLSGSGGGGMFNKSSSPTVTNCIFYANVDNGSDGGGGMYNWDSSPTLTNCIFSANESSDSDGGGMCNDQSSPTVNNCTFIGNHAIASVGESYRGGGMYNSNSTLTVTDCTFIQNEAHSYNYSGALGGGMYNSYSTITVTDCTFSENKVTHDYSWPFGAGGGMYNANSNLTVTNCIFSKNAAASLGGGMYIQDSITTATNCIFSKNAADGSGGGMLLDYSFYCSTTLTNCTVAGNSAVLGGGISCAGENTTTIITNTILWNNDASEGPEIWMGETSFPSTLTISYSDVKDGKFSLHIDPNCILNWGPGMIDSDPLFVDPANNDFHITFLSPCRGSGDNSCVTELTDFEGDPRICQGTVDIGTDECYTHLYITGDQTPGGDIQGKLVGLPGTSPVYIVIGSGVFDPPKPTIYGDLYLMPPRSLFPLIPIPSNGILALTITIPQSPPPPYDLPMQGLVGLNSDSLTNLCVLEVR